MSIRDLTDPELLNDSVDDPKTNTHGLKATNIDFGEKQ